MCIALHLLFEHKSQVLHYTYLFSHVYVLITEHSGEKNPTNEFWMNDNNAVSCHIIYLLVNL